MIAEFPPKDARLGEIVESTEGFGNYTAAAEALLRYEPERAGYFEAAAERLDPLSQTSASAAAWSRVKDQARIREWLGQQPEESLGLIAWRHGGFPQEVRELAREYLEQVAPTVDWNVHVGGTPRLELVEFYVSYFTEDDLVLPRGAFEFLLGLVASVPSPSPEDDGGKHPEDLRRVTVVLDNRSSRLRESLVEDEEGGLQSSS